ncbi:hypothetical protein F5141DRAFT_664703 [Pisolithus sp. B1]|nr:hypothetical protein F5141DRAFT_664703 [Pisolithus sp. B1]
MNCIGLPPGVDQTGRELCGLPESHGLISYFGQDSPQGVPTHVNCHSGPSISYPVSPICRQAARPFCRHTPAAAQAQGWVVVPANESIRPAIFVRLPCPRVRHYIRLPGQFIRLTYPARQPIIGPCICRRDAVRPGPFTARVMISSTGPVGAAAFVMAAWRLQRCGVGQYHGLHRHPLCVCRCLGPPRFCSRLGLSRPRGFFCTG